MDNQLELLLTIQASTTEIQVAEDTIAPTDTGEVKEGLDILAAGKMLSDKNSKVLLNAYNSIGKVLVEAGVIKENAYHAAIMAEGSEQTEEIQAECLTHTVDRAVWFNKLKVALHEFKERFIGCCLNTDVWTFDREETSSSFDLINELQSILIELARTVPQETKNQMEITIARDLAENVVPHLVGLSKQDEETEDETIIVQDENSKSEIDITFSCLSTEIQARADKGSNKYPIQGVLFKIDQPSESIPAVGPGLPLYIPLSVANSLVNKVEGLPLDASDSLRVHASKEIVGTMTRAWINGGDFMVEGHLWQWNQPEKVATIAANEGFLGMSLNAHANGHEEEIGGRRVFVIDKLDLLGANILRKDHATYQNTSLLSAESEQLSIPIAIAASSETQELEEMEETDEIDKSILSQLSIEQEQKNMDLADQIFKLTNSLESFQKSYTEELREIQDSLIQLSATVSTINSEREQIQAAARQEQTQQEKEQERSVLVDSISNAVLQVVDTKFKQFKNPSGQPQRITHSIPLAASAQTGNVNNEVMQLQLQLANIEGQIAGAEGDYTKISKYLDEKRNIEYRLQMAMAGA